MFDTHDIKIETGVSLHVLEWSQVGSHRGDILMLHGLASNSRLWTAPAQCLAQLGYRVFAADQRGHGRSEKPNDGYSPASVADDAASLIKTLNLKSPIVIGQSWGGNIVVELAYRHPGLIAGICGVDGGTIQLSEVFSDWETCVEQLHPPVIEGMRASRLEATIRAIHPDWCDDSIAGAMANMEVLPDGTVRPWLTIERHLKILRGMWEQNPMLCIRESKVPALFIPTLKSGDELSNWEEVKAVSFDSLLTCRDRIKVEVFWDADHDLHAQHPEKFASVVHEAILEGFFS